MKIFAARNMKSIKPFINSLFSIFNLRSLILSVAALACTYISKRNGWTAEYPMVLLGTAVIFPIVFSLNGAYIRREEALRYYAEIKAGLRSIFIAATTWHGGLNQKDTAHFADLTSNVLFEVRAYITSENNENTEREEKVYLQIHELSKHLEKQCRKENYLGGEVGACFSFLNLTIANFEKLKHIYQYRTPRSLQAFSDVFITVLPLLYGPVFAGLSDKINNDILIYIIPVLFVFILSSLDNIQAHLEDPFDGVGVDDIVINAEKFRTSLTENA